MQTANQRSHGEGTGSTLSDINSRTGRNMPQAVATAVVLIVLLVTAMLIRIDLLMWVIVVFMLLALWELRVDFAVIDLHIPVVALWLCCTMTLVSTFYAPRHVLAAALSASASVVIVAIAASFEHGVNARVAKAAAGKVRRGVGNEATSRIPDDKRSSLVEDDVSHSASSASVACDSPVIRNIGVSVFLVLYIAVLAACIILPFTFGNHPIAHAIMVIFLPALSDTGGLLIGAWKGKHKLSPRISPKKSYEGLAGSILFAMAGAFVIFAVTYPDVWSTHWWVPILIGVVVGVVGTFGDLCASMLKRDMGIKDMGHLLKGHGGVMDRVDSILLCAPFFTLILWATGL